jgi:iron-sulfur cluster assembly accessory protein
MATEQKFQKITADMTISEIFSLFPHQSQRLAQTITNAGLHCVGCNAATWETLEAGMLGHGMTRSAIEDLVKKLNAILEEEVDLEKITLTPRAAKKFMEIAEEDGKAGYALRFGDTAGGCSGFEYTLDFAEHPDEDDAILESNGVKIYIKKGSVKRLLGSLIDYVDGLQGSGFKISNPNVKSSCGCGKSQGY